MLFYLFLYNNSTATSRHHSNWLAQWLPPFSRTPGGFLGTTVQLRCLLDCLGLDHEEETELDTNTQHCIHSLHYSDVPDFNFPNPAKARYPQIGRARFWRKVVLLNVYLYSQSSSRAKIKTTNYTLYMHIYIYMHIYTLTCIYICTSMVVYHLSQIIQQ